VTENHDSEDAHTFGSIVSRGIGNISLESTQTNEGEDDLRDDISDLNADDTLGNTAERNFTQTEVESNALNTRHSPIREIPQSESTGKQYDNRPDLTRNTETMKSSTRRFTIY